MKFERVLSYSLFHMIHRKLYKSSTLAILSLFLTCPKILAESPRLEDHHLEVEKKIVNLVDSANEAALFLLERAVNINSGTMNFEGVRRVGSLFRAEFDALGFETEWIEGEAFSRAGHLVARRRGTGTGVLLIGHLDTVFEPDSPFQRFERLEVVGFYA